MRCWSARSRAGPGMERKDLLLENAKIFIEQGKALDKVASRNVKVLVVGNPANTNAYIAMKSAPSLPKKNFTAMMRLDHNRALLAARAEGQGARRQHREADRVGQPFADDVSRLPLRHARGGKELKAHINDENWNRNEFLPKVGKRGAAIIEARGLSSAASAANAAIDHMRDWILGSNGKWVTMGIPSDGSYGIPRGHRLRRAGDHRQRRVHARPRPADRRVLAREDERAR